MSANFCYQKEIAVRTVPGFGGLQGKCLFCRAFATPISVETKLSVTPCLLNNPDNLCHIAFEGCSYYYTENRAWGATSEAGKGTHTLMYFETLRNKALWTLTSSFSECRAIRVEMKGMYERNKTENWISFKLRTFVHQDTTK